jgi:hypothetical protein
MQAYHGNRAQLLRTATVELQKAGLLKALVGKDPAFDLDVARELRRLKDPTLEKDTGNRHAQQAAKILGPVMDAGRAMMNKAGAFIGEVDGYMGRQYHDMMKIRGDGSEAAYQAWRAEAYRRFNIDEMHPDSDAAHIESAMRDRWQSLKSGLFDTASSEALNGFSGGHNLGKKVSQNRSIIFKSADDWFAYNQKFGKGGVMDAIWAGADMAARDAAIMASLGTNPDAMFRKWHNANVDAAAKLNTPAGDKLADKLKTNPNQGLFDLATGKASIPANQTWATIGATTRNLMQFRHLGGVLFSTTSDIPTVMGTLRRNGVPFFKAFGDTVASLMPQGERAKEIALAVHAGMDGATGHILHRFRTEDGVPGLMAEAVNQFHRWNGLTWETDAMKAGMARGLMHNLAFHAEKDFAALDPMMQGTLRRYGIESAEWDVARATAQVADDSRKYITPGDIGDEAVSGKFFNYITDQIRVGMTEPTLRSAMLTTGGQRAGTASGEIIRSLMQFKSFTATFMQRSLGDTFMRGQGAYGFSPKNIDYPGMVHLAVGMTLAGAITNAIRDFTQNKVRDVPQDAAGWGRFAGEAMLTGGATGFLGDTFLGHGLNSAGDVAKHFAGPLPVHIMEALAAGSSVIQGSNRHDRGDIAVKKLVGGLDAATPNIPFFQAGVKYLILHYLSEPGAVERYNRSVKQQERSFIFRP